MLTMLMASLALGAVGHPVSFTYANPKAKKVEIAGDFNAWSKTLPMAKSGGKWTRSFNLPDDSRIEYKLVVDGEWILDPANPVHANNGLGGKNSVWKGPKYRFSVHDGTPKNPMQRLEFQIGGRKVIAYTPAQTQGLPIIVYGDGPMYDSPGRVQNVLENLVEAGKAKPAVIVFVPPTDRMLEYGDDWKSYGDYIFLDVLPTVRRRTDASSLATDTYMGGSSMGGLIALRLAEEFPDQLAGGIQCQSAAVQWKAMSVDYNDVILPSRLRQISPTCRIWLDWGDFEDTLTTANQTLVGTLRSINHAFAFKTTPEGHTWTAWRNRMEAGLTYLFSTKSDSR